MRRFHNFQSRSKDGMPSRTDSCEASQVITNTLLQNSELITPPVGDPNIASEANLAMVLASSGIQCSSEARGTRTSLTLATSRSMVNPISEESLENGLGPNYTAAVAEILQRAQMQPPRSQNHTYNGVLKRANTKISLGLDPVSNKSEWKMQAR